MLCACWPSFLTVNVYVNGVFAVTSAGACLWIANKTSGDEVEGVMVAVGVVVGVGVQAGQGGGVAQGTFVAMGVKVSVAIKVGAGVAVAVDVAGAVDVAVGVTIGSVGTKVGVVKTAAGCPLAHN